jgi:succinoglycan biosynthesis protein ExoM
MSEIPPPDVSIIVCSYSRTDLLRRTLRSIAAALRPEGPVVEVIVVDNGPTGHVAPIVAEAAADAAGRVTPIFRAIVARPPNISVARNAGLRAASAEIVGFVDDDQAPEPGWLDQLFTGLLAGADVAFGRIDVEVEGGTTDVWLALGRPHERVYDLPDGTIINPPEASRPLRVALSSGGTLIRRATILAAEPFDPGFGLSGGEDYDFFLGLDRDGRRFVWCANSVVIEWVPAARLKTQYRAIRGFSGGQVYAAAAVRNAPRPAATAVSLALRGLAQVGIYGAAYLVAAARADRRRTYLLDRMASGAGKAFWWRKIGLYAAENKARGD